MDVISLTNQLSNNPDKIIKILEKLGCNKIKYNENKSYITSTRPENGADNAMGQLTYVDNLTVHQTTRSYSGNIFTLTMDVKNVNFPRALELVASWSGLKDIKTAPIKYPFGGFFKNISKQQSMPELSMKVYDESDLPKAEGTSYKYIKDGVSAKVQEELGIRYDHESNSICIPIHDYLGRLVGCKNRNNDSNCDMSHRFWASLEYSKTLILYGYTHNYKYIIQKKIVIIVESEKAVGQCIDMGCYLALAIGGHTISDVQAKYIKALNADKIYLAFDEGLSEDELKYNAKKLVVDNKLYKNKVGYVYDEDNKYLPKGSKMSPTDRGKETFNNLIKKCTRWL